MKKLLTIIYATPSFFIMVIVLYSLAGFQLDSVRIYNNLLKNIGASDHTVFQMIYVAYILIISGLHILVSLFLLILNHINKRLFFLGLVILCFMPIRMVLAFGLNFGYLPLVIFEFHALKALISYVAKNNRIEQIDIERN